MGSATRGQGPSRRGVGIGIGEGGEEEDGVEDSVDAVRARGRPPAAAAGGGGFDAIRWVRRCRRGLLRDQKSVMVVLVVLLSPPPPPPSPWSWRRAEALCPMAPPAMARVTGGVWIDAVWRVQG